MPRILVADDNTNIQKMVVLAFQERGVEVIAVGNGEAAVRRLPDANPDLVLADVFMPVHNGYEVCEFVKKDPRFSHVPVILLTRAAQPADYAASHQLGAVVCMAKPFKPERLLHVVRLVAPPPQNKSAYGSSRSASNIERTL